MKIFVITILLAASAAAWQLMRPQVKTSGTHQRDPRWPATANIVDLAPQRFIEANDANNRSSDFVKFMATKRDILSSLKSAIVVLDELLISCKQSKSSRVEIQKHLARAERLATEIELDLRINHG
ncbi:MAG: hypothetical protein H8E25_07830 [Planctomycetes bacterium]|nr:hypothetical protein [Planctomycetota bacterium]